ncbi:protein of unknown function [Pseudomonas sp. JV241A]|nr:protein of unknown function [Pseudomonas sp. JV241A]
MAPPSLARKLPKQGRPRPLSTRRARPSSRSWADLSPQALKRQLTPARPCCGWQMKLGPESRHQLSLTAISISSMLAPHSARAWSTALGSTTIFTGSKRAMALATRAKSTCTSARVTPQVDSHRAWLCGQTIQVAACRAHSAGMNQPLLLALSLCIAITFS